MNINGNKGKIIAIVAGVIAIIVVIILALMFIRGHDSNTPPDQSNINGPSSSTTEPDDPYQLYDIEVPSEGPPTHGDPVDNVVTDVTSYDPHEEADGFDGPGVIHYFNSEVDTDKDNRISKTEWEAWLAEHPEDLNKDLVITDEEKSEYAARQVNPDGEHDTENPDFNPQTYETMPKPTEEELRAEEQASREDFNKRIQEAEKNLEGAKGKVDPNVPTDKDGNPIGSKY